MARFTVYGLSKEVADQYADLAYQDGYKYTIQKEEEHSTPASTLTPRQRVHRTKSPKYPERSLDIIFQELKAGPINHEKAMRSLMNKTGYKEGAFYSAIALLEKCGLVFRPSDGIYQLTDKGRSTENTANIKTRLGEIG